MKFCHLHVHDEYSQLDGFGTAKQYAQEAKRLGFGYLGITNHSNVDGCIKFQKACDDAGIKPIFGCEFYIVKNLTIKEKGEKRYHICCFAKNKTGWQNILKMLTIANIDGFYWKPRIDSNILVSHCEGMKITTACSNSFLIAEWGMETVEMLKQTIGRNNLFLEIMPHKMKEQIIINKLAISLAEKYDLSIIATNDCHYPTVDGALPQEVLLAIQGRAKWKDPNRWRFNIDGLYLRTAAEMIKAFKEQNIVDVCTVHRAMINSHLFARSCSNFRIEKLLVQLPLVPKHEKEDETELLTNLCKKEFGNRIKPSKSKKEIAIYKDRMKEELGLICQLGFQRYFLIVWELIAWCKENSIMTGPGRGSVGGCLVAYLLGITKVDPIEHKLLFTRFISPARIDLPDIDMDFEDEKRDLIRKHLEDNYGRDYVAGVSTFLKLKGRAAIRDVSRVFNISITDTNAACKAIVVRSGGDFRSDFTIEDAFSTFEDGIKFRRKYPKVSKIAMALEGQIRGSGMHAAAICISNRNLKNGEQCNLCKRKGGITVVNWDKNDVEYMGLMKLDILGLSALTILNRTRDMVKKNYNTDLDFDSLTLDDKKVYEEIGKGHTVGAFQIGSMGLSSYCKELEVSNFEDLVHATSLWRPGTLRSGLVTEFVERKNGKPYKSIHPIIAELTKDTYGIIIYQEQVMIFMYELAGLPWKTCDTVRKVISKSQGEELFMNFKNMFVDGCKKLGTLDENIAGRVWEELASFGSYGFNKSHAVEYSVITYWDMYCKVHYPKEFIACSLTYGGADKKEEYINEAKRLGLKIVLPTVGKSSAKYWYASADKNELYAPFIEVKGIGEKTAQKLTKANEKDANKGFFLSNSKPSKMQMLLNRLQQYNEAKENSEEETNIIQQLFQFNISADPMQRMRGIYEALKKNIKLIENVDFSAISQKSMLLFCRMPEIKFGYRQAVLKSAKERKDVTTTKHYMMGTADNLGGVYGFVKDLSKSANAMLVFSSNLYSRKKDEVEHCEGKWMLIEAITPRKGTNNIFCERMSTEEELNRCEFDEISVNLIKKSAIMQIDIKSLKQCEACSLRQEATVPVPPSRGKKNILILGEAPGKEEDKVGKGFVGRAGEDILWPELAKYNLLRSFFHVSNVVKCFPSTTKTPSAKIIKICSSKWLDVELQNVKPIIILALGNTALHYLKNKESGISQLNGTTEWDPKRNMWICWCIHPASVLYQQENKTEFSKGIDNFCTAIRNLSSGE